MTSFALGSKRHDAVLDAARIIRRGTAERRWTRLSLRLGLVLVGGITVLCLVHSLLGLPSPDHQNLHAALAAPSWQHPFGTDELGRDVLSRTLAAGLLDLAVGVSVTGLSVVIGLMLGAIAGFFGGWVGGTIMRICDVVMAFPFLVLILGIVAAVGPGLRGVFIGIVATDWAVYARVSRAEMLVVREQEYVQAAETLGYKRSRILLKHSLPNIWRPSVVYSMADIVLNISLLATLSYLGLGVQPPAPEWGQIIANGQGVLLTAWWVSTLPGVVIVIVGIGFSLIGDSLADILGVEGRSSS